MISYFEEIGLIDRPFVELKTSINGKPFEARVRALSGKESDELDALQMDEYGRILKRLTEPQDNGVSELERVTRIYASKSAREIVEQLIPTRENEIQTRGLALSGIDLRKELAHMQDLPEGERDEYAKVQNDRLEASKKEAEEEIRQELLQLSVDDLAHQMAQVNVNLRALNMSARVHNDSYLFAVLYRPDSEEKCFAERADVAKVLQASTIQNLVSLAKQVLATDIPFGSPGVEEPSTPPPSPSTSEADTPDGGTPTETTNVA